jgi:hypothetical protein
MTNTKLELDEANKTIETLKSLIDKERNKIKEIDERH